MAIVHSVEYRYYLSARRESPSWRTRATMPNPPNYLPCENGRAGQRSGHLRSRTERQLSACCGLWSHRKQTTDVGLLHEAVGRRLGLAPRPRSKRPMHDPRATKGVLRRRRRPSPLAFQRQNAFKLFRHPWRRLRPSAIHHRTSGGECGWRGRLSAVVHRLRAQFAIHNHGIFR